MDSPSANTFTPQDDDWDCPLCMEEMDAADRLFRPCPCGYQICRFCWHKINQDMNKLCPACRREYCPEWIQAQNSLAAQRASASPPTTTPSAAAKREKTSTANTSQSTPATLATQPYPNPNLVSSERESRDRELLVSARRHLTNLRVIQKNLVYVIGISPKIAFEETLVSPEYFGQYGKIVKIVVNKRNYIGVNSGHLPSASVYVTYSKREDAAKAIKLIDGTLFDGRTLRASYGTTKYCTFFLRGIGCQNPGCMYLHDQGEEQDSFTKEQMAEGWHLDRFIPKEQAGDVSRAAFVAAAVQTSAPPTVSKVPTLRDFVSAGQLHYAQWSASHFFSFNPFMPGAESAESDREAHFLPRAASKSAQSAGLWSGNQEQQQQPVNVKTCMIPQGLVEEIKKVASAVEATSGKQQNSPNTKAFNAQLFKKALEAWLALCPTTTTTTNYNNNLESTKKSSKSAVASQEPEAFHKTCTASLQSFVQNMPPNVFQEVLLRMHFERLFEAGGASSTETLLLEGLQQILQQMLPTEA